MANSFTIDIGKDFSRFPAGRTPDDGRYSGQAFRERYLKDRLGAGQPIKIFLDNALSYGSSFLEEAFGGSVRIYNVSLKEMQRIVTFVSEDPFLIEEIWSYIKDASDAQE